MPIDGIVVAAGAGERFGGTTPKAFAELAGTPLVVRSVGSLLHADVRRIVVVVRAEDLDRALELLRPLKAAHTGPDGSHPDLEVVVGGASRTESTRLGLSALPGDDDDIVVVHDAARPLASVDLVRRVVAAVQAPVVGATAVVPSTDTIALLDGIRITHIPDRATLGRVQTPQAFRRAVLGSAHAAAHAEGGTVATDDVGLVLRFMPGAAIAAVPGEASNLKITVARDLELAERLLAEQLGEPPPDATGGGRLASG